MKAKIATVHPSHAPELDDGGLVSNMVICKTSRARVARRAEGQAAVAAIVALAEIRNWTNCGDLVTLKVVTGILP